MTETIKKESLDHAEKKDNPGGERVSQTSFIKPANITHERNHKNHLDSANSLGSGPIYTLQVASYMKESDAMSSAERLKSKGYPASVSKVDVHGKGAWHRVKVGRFKTKEEARIFGLGLETQEAEMESFHITLVIEKGK